jgi:ATP-dependent exoDNAse (exonuclease V) alpha subunit
VPVRLLKERGELGNDVKVQTRRSRNGGAVAIKLSERNFAPGDRVMFLKNDPEMNVKKGTLGTVLQVDQRSMRVALEGVDGREVSFVLSDYAAPDHGDAGTVPDIETRSSVF